MDGLVVTDLTAEPTVVPQGELVTIVAAVENREETQTTEELQLVLYGEVVTFRTVTIDPGETQEVEFTRQMEQPGEYEAQVKDATVTITVEGDDSDETPTETNGPGFTAIAAMLALVVLGLRMRRCQ